MEGRISTITQIYFEEKNLSELKNAIHCGVIARKENFGINFTLSCMFHNIGKLIYGGNNTTNIEKIGSDWLTYQGWGNEIPNFVSGQDEKFNLKLKEIKDKPKTYIDDLREIWDSFFVIEIKSLDDIFYFPKDIWNGNNCGDIIDWEDISLGMDIQDAKMAENAKENYWVRYYWRKGELEIQDKEGEKIFAIVKIKFN